MSIAFIKKDSSAVIPLRTIGRSAGYEIYSKDDGVKITIPALGKFRVSTGLSVEMPLNCYGRIAALSDFSWDTFTYISGGVIDRDYRGEILVTVFNFGHEDVTIQPKQRFAQLILQRVETPPVYEATIKDSRTCKLTYKLVDDQQDQKIRGEGGFGSTGSGNRNSYSSSLRREQHSPVDGRLAFFRNNRNAIMPFRATQGSAGYDLFSKKDDTQITVPAYGKAIVDTGLSVYIPRNCNGRIAPRSGFSWNNFVSIVSEFIDMNYNGEISIIIFNHGDKDVTIKPAQRIAQFILERVETPPVYEAITDHRDGKLTYKLVEGSSSVRKKRRGSENNASPPKLLTTNGRYPEEGRKTETRLKSVVHQVQKNLRGSKRYCRPYYQLNEQYQEKFPSTNMLTNRIRTFFKCKYNNNYTKM